MATQPSRVDTKIWQMLPQSAIQFKCDILGLDCNYIRKLFV